MIRPTLQAAETQKMSDFSYNSDYSQYKGISWFEFDDADATTIDTSVDSDEHEDDREVPRGVRAYQNDDRLPQACYGEAERERPEPERSLNVGAPLSIRAHEIPLGTKPPSDAHSTIYRGVQQELYSIFNDLEGFVCGLEYNHDIVKGKLFYRKKVLTRQKVGQRDLCKLIDEKRAQAIVLDKEALPYYVIRRIHNGTASFSDEFEVMIAAAEWSAWKSWESHEADKASFKAYQAAVTKKPSSTRQRSI